LKVPLFELKNFFCPAIGGPGPPGPPLSTPVTRLFEGLSQTFEEF